MLGLCFISDNYPYHVANSLLEVEKGKILEPNFFLLLLNYLIIMEALRPSFELLASKNLNLSVWHLNKMLNKES